MSEIGMTPNQYINHHLINYTSSGSAQRSLVDFSVLNLDTIFLTVLLGFLTCFLLRVAAKRASSGVPGRFQAAVELLFEFVDNSCKEMIHSASSRRVVAPLGMALLVWVFFMNAMDLLPVDLLPWLWRTALGKEEAALRVVPTADINTALALAISVLGLCFFYSVKIKGFRGWMHELVSAPFGSNISLSIFNFLMNLVEYLSKTLSHGMRLWGNLYAGEIVFMVIALLGGAWQSTDSLFGNLALFALHVILGLAWAIFHILIIALQAYLFMILAFVYIGQAHDSH
ncbi:MAG: F0F1 ATP synthase subunit A [Neisseriaceae bacterium]